MKCKVLLYAVLATLVKHASPSEIQASPGTNASLPCHVTPSLFVTGGEIDESLVKVTWRSNGSEVAAFGQAATHIKAGFSWDAGEFIRGDFSLTLVRARLELQGVYECTLSYNSRLLHLSNVSFSVLSSPTLSVPQQRVVLDTESHLTCIADGFYPPPVSFFWTRDEQEIQPPYEAEGEQTVDGYYAAVSNLTFTPSRDDHNATFGCRVSHNGSYQELDFQLNITYLPSVRLSAIPSLSHNHPLTLYCDIERFYPDDVSVTWLQNGTALPEPPSTEQNPDGTFTTRRYYTLDPGQREQGGRVECAVSQPGVPQPVGASTLLQKPVLKDDPPVLTKSAKASVAMMCISIVLVFLLCFGFSWRRRDEKHKSLSVSGIILPPRLVVGQKGRVSVSIEGRRVDRVRTTWLLNDTPITDVSTKGASEASPLLPSMGLMCYYKLHTQGPLYSSGSGTHQLISALTFIPQILVHKGAVFKCQVSYVGKDKIVVEKVSEKFTVLSAPEVSQIQLAETAHDSDVICLTVQASRFHPDVITFRWFCEGGELSPVASQASSAPRPNAEGYFSAYSQCKLPRSELENGRTKVWVSVHHMALKQPVTRETKGFIRRPHVSDIISHASTDRVLTLVCEMTDFYPPSVSVTWLKLREGEQDDREEEVMEGGEMWGPVQTQARLYRATAFLRRAATNQQKERGGGVICRVEHCSLEEPIERLWRNVDVVAPSIPPAITVCWTSEGVGVFSILLKGGHPKVKLLWAAGSHTLSPLVSSETEEMGDDGQRELKSVCALERSTSRQSAPSRQPEMLKNGDAIRTTSAVTDPHTEGIKYIDDKVDEENNEIHAGMREEVKSEGGGDSDGESEQDPSALRINRVTLDNERLPLRVCVEIAHPALRLPVYRAWTEPILETTSPS